MIRANCCAAVTATTAAVLTSTLLLGIVKVEHTQRRTQRRIQSFYSKNHNYKTTTLSPCDALLLVVPTSGGEKARHLTLYATVLDELVAGSAAQGRTVHVYT